MSRHFEKMLNLDTLKNSNQIFFYNDPIYRLIVMSLKEITYE